MKTFEEWVRDLEPQSFAESILANQAWHARDAEIAALERKLERVKVIVVELREVEKLYLGVYTDQPTVADRLQSALEDQ